MMIIKYHKSSSYHVLCFQPVITFNLLWTVYFTQLVFITGKRVNKKP